MSEVEPVVLWEDRGAVALVTINRPRQLNALNADVMLGLTALLRERGHREGLRAIVLSGAGGKAFVAGADIAQMQDFSVAQAEAFAYAGQALSEAIEALPVPLIAAVNGFALGGGCELAMAADIIVAGPTAKFGQPEVKLGVIPGFGGTQRLVRRCGLAVAMDLCLTGRILGAEEAQRVGLVSRVVEGDAVEAALGVAAEIEKMGPFAVRMARRALHENADADLYTGLAAERSLFAMCFATADQKEGMKAFVEKRAAVWQGR
jgi:enoyl-CoA hydratase